jgi:hypothetical protein
VGFNNRNSGDTVQQTQITSPMPMPLSRMGIFVDPCSDINGKPGEFRKLFFFVISG